jgi:hypothetical protein
VDVRVLCQQGSGRCLRFVELAVVDERQHGIRRVGWVVVAQVVGEQLIVIGTVIASERNVSMTLKHLLS